MEIVLISKYLLKIPILIAQINLGQRKLYIYTRSHFLTDRVAAKWKTEGDSRELLEMLKSAVQSMDDVELVWNSGFFPTDDKWSTK